MVDQPTGEMEIPDDIIDAVLNEDDEGDIESTEAPDAAAPEPVPTDDTPAPATTDTAPAGDATPEPAPAAQPVSETASAPAASAEGKPFQFKASGTEQSLPWALERADGSVVIPKDSANEFRRVLASQRELETNYRQAKRHFDRELTAARTQRTAKDAEAEAYIAWGAELAKKTPQELYDYLSEFQGQIPRFELDLKKKQLDEREKLLDEQRRGPQLSPEEQHEQIVEQIGGELHAEWQRIAEHPQLQALTPTERQTFYDRWTKKPHRLVRQIRTAEEAQQYGGAIGDRLFDPTEFYEDLNYVIGLKQQASPKPAAPSAAAQQNATRNADKQPTVNRIPPAPRNVVPAGQPRDKNGQFAKGDEGRKQWRQAFMKDDEDDAA